MAYEYKTKYFNLVVSLMNNAKDEKLLNEFLARETEGGWRLVETIATKNPIHRAFIFEQEKT